jgi:uncharacterized membrane protein HdeD (DUF308 family)
VLWPLLELEALRVLFGPFIFCDGLVAIAAFVIQGDRKAWLVFLEGAVGMLMGLVVYFGPGIGNRVLFFLVAVWALGTGLARLLIGFNVRRLRRGARLLELSGLTSIAFGIVFVVRLGSGGVSLVWMISTYAILQGSFLILAGLRFLGKEPEPLSQA